MQGNSPASESALTPAKKRPRPSSFDADGDVTLIEETGPAKIVRDPVYYKESGDCKIRVDDTLFCIHRFLLERDSPTFQTMFRLPQGGSAPQGTSDEDPIVLVGDTVEQFRALCWALYALPNEIVKENADENSIEKLAHVATISHKYQLAAFQSWSMDLVRRRCETSGPPYAYLHGCPPHLLPLFIRLFILYGENALLNRAINAWVFRLGVWPKSRCYLPISAFSDAFLCAEEHQLRGFLGRLYETRLKVAHRDLSASGFSQIDFPFQDLEPTHLQRILRGSWLLSTVWQHLVSHIPDLPRTRCPQHTSKCIPEWTELWGKAGTVGGPADVRRKLQSITVLLCEDDTPAIFAPSCIDKGKEVVESLIKQLEEALPDYFLGPA